ncbi:hypothetical protein DAPPUDRAFT_257054 [Daphnia pulex]|uniref:NHR domain-containing protein n=1 Tax=Daphnia pulex TaxID=6669 RepID=E9HCQ3_DAPPU|nr:hypothetical protein DAPPUDRAFT_257054 [Daphnia pulex]|eukprot:EFX70477.1 hypothetical protein DAPPUDRAFT_257054 [Daphnia pulex]
MEHLAVGDVVSIRRTVESTLHFAVNGRDLSVCVCNIPHGAHVLMDLHGMIQSVSVKSIGKLGSLPESLATTPDVLATNSLPTAGGALPLSLSQLALREAMQGIQSALSSRFGSAFSHQQRFHGRNVVLKNNGQTAQRTASYNQGLIYSEDPLIPRGCFQVKIEQLDERWTGSLMLGVTAIPPEKSRRLRLPARFNLSGLVGSSADGPFTKVAGRYDPDLKFDLNELRVGQSADVHLSQMGHHHVLINGLDCCSLAWIGTSESLLAVVDLYGQTTKMSTYPCAQLQLSPRLSQLRRP